MTATPKTPSRIQLLVFGSAIAVVAFALLIHYLGSDESVTASTQTARIPQEATNGSQQPEMAIAKPPTVRVAAREFPDGCIWVKAQHNGAPIEPLCLQWVDPSAREFLVADKPATSAGDGFYTISLPEDSSGHMLAVISDQFATAWICDPDPNTQYDIQFTTTLLPHLEVRDIASLSLVSGFKIMASATKLDGIPYDLAGTRPGPDAQTAITRATERNDSTYQWNGHLPFPNLNIVGRHSVFILLPPADKEASIEAHKSRFRCQMPTVAAVRYIGSDLLEGGFQYTKHRATDAATQSRLNEIRSLIKQEHLGSIVSVYLESENHYREPHPQQAFCHAQLAYGDRRIDKIDPVRLAFFCKPTEIPVQTIGPVTIRERVQIEAPPAFRGVEVNFRIGLSGGMGNLRTAKFGDTVELTPGKYHISQIGEFAYGMFENSIINVSPGSENSFRLKWKPDAVMHRIDYVSSMKPDRISVHAIGPKGPMSVLTMNEQNGVAYFWLRRKMSAASIRASGCIPVDVVFGPTEYPDVVATSCFFEKAK